jgi:hypothetical protein
VYNSPYMNIFYLSEDPILCAKYHNDSHCVKMILEYAQLMCTAHRELDVISKGSLMDTTLYKATHKNHPSAVWVRESKANYEFLHKLFSALCNEYTHRYGKIHKTDRTLRKLLYWPPKNMPDGEFTQPAQAMPNDVKHEDSITAYRNYYKVHKDHLAKWKTTTPTWFTEH